VARQSVWFPEQSLSTVLAGAQFAVNLTSAFASAAGLGSLRGYTLVRTLGELSIRVLAPASTGMLVYSAGILMNTTGDPPTPAVVDPLVSTPGWLWWTGGHLGQDGTETSVGFFGGTTKYVPINSRAMRKHDTQESSLFWEFKNGSSETLTVAFALRMLFKLP